MRIDKVTEFINKKIQKKMALIRNIVNSILPPEDTAEMWLDGEGKLRAYTLGVWKEVSATELNSEEVIKASQGYPYNVTLGETPVKNEVFEGDLMITYNFGGGNDKRLFAEGSFLANHVKKVNIMGFDVEDMSSLPDIITLIKATYSSGSLISVIFTIDTDTIEGDLFGINYYTDPSAAQAPKNISVNCKVKSLDCSHISGLLGVSMLNSPTDILEQGSIKGQFSMIFLPLALKNLEENAFAKFSQAEGYPEMDCDAYGLVMPSLTVPESLPQSLGLSSEGDPMVYFPALVGERTYKDYVKDVFNIDVTTEAGAAKVLCFDVSTGSQVTFKQS